MIKKVSVKYFSYKHSLTDRFPSSHFGVHQLRPASVMIEVTHYNRYVCVTTLTERLAIVHALQHGNQALVLLYMTSNADTEKP